MKIIVIWIFLLWSGLSIAQEKLFVQDRATFVGDAAVRDSVKDKCNLEEFFGNKISQAVLLVIPEAVLISNEAPPNGAAELNISILAARGIGGAPALFAGNTVSVRSDFKVGNQVIATKVATMSSGAFKNLGGTCSNLEKDADAIAKQIVIWLYEVRTQQSVDSRKKAEALPIEVSDNTIYLISPIQYVDGNTVRDSIKVGCALPSLTEAYILDQAYREGLTMKPLTSPNEKGTAMRVSIVDVTGFAGGIYTGTKAVNLHVDLLKNGMVISSKDFERHTIGASFSGLYGGACTIFDKLVKSFSILNVRWVMEQLSIESTSQKKKRVKQSKKLEQEEKSIRSNVDKDE